MLTFSTSSSGERPTTTLGWSTSIMKNTVLTRAKSEAVRFGIEAGEKRNEHGEKAQVPYHRTHVDLRPGHQPRVVVSLAPTANSRACLVPPSARSAPDVPSND